MLLWQTGEKIYLSKPQCPKISLDRGHQFGWPITNRILNLVSVTSWTLMQLEWGSMTQHTWSLTATSHMLDITATTDRIQKDKLMKLAKLLKAWIKKWKLSHITIRSWRIENSRRRRHWQMIRELVGKSSGSGKLNRQRWQHSLWRAIQPQRWKYSGSITRTIKLYSRISQKFSSPVINTQST